MVWLLLCAIVAATIALLLILWRRWIAPWQQVEELVVEIGRGEPPRTFVINGGTQAQRIGLRLEQVSEDLQQLNKQIAKRESGMQTIFSAMHDALLVVDSNRHVILANDMFRKLFALPEISEGTPLLDIVRDATLDRLIEEALGSGGPVRSGVALGCSQL